MLELWRRVFSGWARDTRNPLATFVEETLPQVQQHVSHVVADRAAASFLAAFDTWIKASVLPYACCVPQAVLLPGAPSTCLSKGDFVLAGRHLLGLGVYLFTTAPHPQGLVATTIATQPCHCGVTNAKHLDDGMACNPAAGMV